MKRKILPLSLVLCFAILLILFFIRNQNRNPINERTYDAIDLGMPENGAMMLVPIRHRALGGRKNRNDTKIESQAEAGKAYFKSDEVFVKQSEDGTFLFFDVATSKQVAKVRFWDSDDYELVILFSPDGEVIGKTLRKFVSTKAGWWDRIREFLNLL